MTQHDNCSKSKAKTILENKIWARNSNFWNLNFYPQIGVFLLSPSNSYQGRKMKTRGWSPTEFVWRLCQIFSLKMAPRTKDLQCFHIKWTHCSFTCFFIFRWTATQGHSQLLLLSLLMRCFHPSHFSLPQR